MTKRFKADPFDTTCKDIWIYGPDELRIRVDYDDVDHPTVCKQVEKMLAILNERWDEAEGG